MNQKLLLFLCTTFAIASISLAVTQLLQTQRSVDISDNLFHVSVNSAMDDVIDQLNRLKVEDYINQKDRYKLLKYKRVEEITSRMRELVQNNAALFYDEERITFGTALQDSAYIKDPKHLSLAETQTIEQYNRLINNKNKVIGDEGYYDRFVNDLSAYIYDNLFSGSTFNYPQLETLICDKMLDAGIDIHPQVAVLNGVADTFLYITPNADGEKLRTSPYRYSVQPDGNNAYNYFILLHFPRSALMIKDSGNIYNIVAYILICIIIASFIITIWMIFNQNKIDKMKNDFINNMTHEIKTPLSTISLTCEMLSDTTIEADTQNRATYLGIIQNESHRMQVLVETILQSSKLESKNYTLSLTELDIHEIIEEVALSFQLQVENKNGYINLDLFADPSLFCADRLHVTNMLYNLIDNAVKYSQQAPEITVTTRTNNNHIVLEIADHGIGINKEDQKHIFEKFYRVSTGNIHNVKGFGIGLNYVKQVVDLHHGTIHVDSKPGCGTTFTITLPTDLSPTKQSPR